MLDSIKIKGARVNNLKNISLSIPRGKLVVFTGLSGSGKSSLAFDTIYAEGQRRYVESLSSYARQFLGQMDKPDVDLIEGLSPAISIDQKTTVSNPRSTVGTVTEIYDYLRLLYARVGTAHCPICKKEIRQQSIDEMSDAIFSLPMGTKLILSAPLVTGGKGEHAKLFQELQKEGFARVKVDGEIYDLDSVPKLSKTKKHDIDLVVDRIVLREDVAARLNSSMETALKKSGGLLKVQIVDGEELLFSQNYSCPDCSINLQELSPRLFSFNNPHGACEICSGLGFIKEIGIEYVIPDMHKSLNDGAINVMGIHSAGDSSSTSRTVFVALSEHYGFDLNTPFQDLSPSAKEVILYGTKGHKIPVHFSSFNGEGTYKISYEGLIPSLFRRYKETNSDAMRQSYEEYMKNEVCHSCDGDRLKPEALAVTIGMKNIQELARMDLLSCYNFLKQLHFEKNKKMIADPIIKELLTRLKFLIDVGLSYLSLHRSASTLSGGEAQRIRLATQIGSGLMGVLYILDEPSIGLHQKDNEKLIKTLKRLRDLGNSLIVVEHDEDTLLSADYIVDIGPGAGEQGGEVVATGSVDDLIHAERSITGQYLSGKKQIIIPKKRRTPSAFLKLYGACENNLKNIDVSFPLGVFCCVSGVSGSGKSTLVNEILGQILSKELNHAKASPGKYDRIEGLEQLDKIIIIDQSPIGRTSRSNPATYTGVFDLIRSVFANTNDAKAHGYDGGRFSFNVKGGRCEACSGDGYKKIEMHFMSDIYVPCEVCQGKRYNRETLQVKFKGYSIADVLQMTVEEALRVFENHPQIHRKLQTLYDVGLSYIRLGQSSTTLSGGEAQRVKLATELSRRATGKTLLLLDEPTTGLHVDDVNRLIQILQRLTKQGNSILVIEHNLDVLKSCDYIIDLGPDGGDKGGTVVASGTPEEIAKTNSYTAEYLKRALKIT